MNDFLLTFRSVTPAQRGEGIIKRAGMPCTLQRTPRHLEEQGCGYSLRIRSRDIAAAMELLRTHGVAYQKVYALRESGKLEELRL